MPTVSFMRGRLRSILAPALGLATLAYFGFHAVHGERGLLVWWQLRQDLQAAQTEQAALAAERETLEHRVRLLRKDHLHPDMLDERARAMLNLIGPDEVVVVPPPR